VAIEKNIGAFLDMDWPGTKVIVGDGPDLPMLKKKFNTAHFAGRQTGKDLADHFRSADIFAFPSKTDTFGIVLIEAMACGLPIAAYPVTGPIDIVTDQRLGALSLDLGEAAKAALAAPGTREERFQYLQDHYSWRVAADQFIRAQELARITPPSPTKAI
jgi:glycosyltransferase involved in cell wall biosynthesis